MRIWASMGHPVAALLGILVAVATAAATAVPAAAAPGGNSPNAAAASFMANPASTAAPTGWASVDGGTTGGAGAPSSSTYVVHDRAQLLDAFANNGQPDSPKVIYIEGTIQGNQAADGALLGEQDYAPGYSISDYMSCFDDDGAVFDPNAFPYCATIDQERAAGEKAEGAQIELSVPSNTTLLGVGGTAGFTMTNLILSGVNNIIIRNLTFESPLDFFTSWGPTDFSNLFFQCPNPADNPGGRCGSWNAAFDAVSALGATHVWVDHDVFTDGRFPDSTAPVGFPDGVTGNHVDYHDGEFDITNSSDLVTVSFSQFLNHEKTELIGSGDGHTADIGHLRVTWISNLLSGTDQRSPRVRFGEVDLVNNYYVANVQDPEYPALSSALQGPTYFVGVGFQSKVFSRYNSFNYEGPGASDAIVTWNWGGTTFFDQGSWFNSKPDDVNGEALAAFDQYRSIILAEDAESGTTPPSWTGQPFTEDVGWNPADFYQYQPLRSPVAVKEVVALFSGVGRLNVRPPA